MSKPSPRKIEYEVGKDAYGRTVLLRFEAGYSNHPGSWTINTLAANQRDEDQHVGGLTADVILAMAEVIKAGGAK